MNTRFSGKRDPLAENVSSRGTRIDTKIFRGTRHPLDENANEFDNTSNGLRVYQRLREGSLQKKTKIVQLNASQIFSVATNKMCSSSAKQC